MKLHSPNKFRSWISVTWSALMLSVITYGLSSRNLDILMIAMAVLLMGWCSAKILSEGFEGLINIIENTPESKLEEDKHE